MQNKIKQIIDSMDVKANREEACLKAAQILEMDSAVLKILAKIGHAIKTDEPDLKKRKKDLRAIIFLIAYFSQKNSVPVQTLKDLKVTDFLYELSQQGFQSAEKTLHDMDIFESDIYQDQLLSLPIVDSLPHDREISVNEAVEEIKMSRLYSGPKGRHSHSYVLGHDEKRVYEIYRIGKTLFAFRDKKFFK